MKKTRHYSSINQVAAYDKKRVEHLGKYYASIDFEVKEYVNPGMDAFGGITFPDVENLGAEFYKAVNHGKNTEYFINSDSLSGKNKNFLSSIAD